MNEVDQHLLHLIASGDPQGWRVFVDRFQPRLYAFAKQRVGRNDVAEDLVQETFVAFLRSRENYRQSGALESYLFQILRHRIIDHYRRCGQAQELPACEFATDSTDVLSTATSREPSASWYIRRQEQNDLAMQALADAIRRLAEFLQSGERFKELKIAEGLFFAKSRNQQLAAVLNVSENEIATTKRRLISRMQDELKRSVIELSSVFEDSNDSTDLMHQVWVAERPSCPKRSTLGRFTLGILPEPWIDYVDFHVHTLGCTYCLANLDELKMEAASTDQQAVRQRLFQSTIGFFSV